MNQGTTEIAASENGHPGTARAELREKVLALRGKKSLGLIALEFGITRNAVAGIFFRSLNLGVRSKGTGRGGPFPYASEVIPTGRPPSQEQNPAANPGDHCPQN